jgi:hypothetical protein
MSEFFGWAFFNKNGGKKWRKGGQMSLWENRSTVARHTKLLHNQNNGLKFCATSLNFMKKPKVNNNPLGENSPKLVTLNYGGKKWRERSAGGKTRCYSSVYLMWSMTRASFSDVHLNKEKETIVRGLTRSGTDVTALKIFSPKISTEKSSFSVRNTAIFRYIINTAILYISSVDSRDQGPMWYAFENIFAKKSQKKT